VLMSTATFQQSGFIPMQWQAPAPMWYAAQPVGMQMPGAGPVHGYVVMVPQNAVAAVEPSGGLMGGPMQQTAATASAPGLFGEESNMAVPQKPEFQPWPQPQLQQQQQQRPLPSTPLPQAPQTSSPECASPGPIEGGQGQGVQGEVPSVQKLTAAMGQGGESREWCMNILLMPGMVQFLSFQAEGCRLVQSALEHTHRRTAAKLAEDLQGHIVSASMDQHANFVVQKIIDTLTPQEVPFVAAELAVDTVDTAQHKYGCRIFCRLVESAAADLSIQVLIDAILAQADATARHKYGHHVVETVMDHGLPRQQAQVALAMRQSLVASLQDRNGVYVIKKVLRCASPADSRALAWDILGLDFAALVALIAGQAGNGVAQTLLQHSEPVARRAKELLMQPEAQMTLNASKQGCRLCKQIFGDNPVAVAAHA